jgi:hypothetical protein
MILLPLLALAVILGPRTASAQAATCGMRQLRQHLGAVDDACCADGACGDASVPGTCSAACAEVFVPFWNACAPMLSSQGDPEAELFAQFSLSCLRAVSPPGSCGAECSEANFLCRHNEVRLACCEEDHDCVELGGGGTSLGTAGRFSPPNACGFECSLVLPAFWQACEPYMRAELRDQYDAADLASYAAATEACEDQDPADLLDTLYERQYVTGCVLHTAGLSHGDASHDRLELDPADRHESPRRLRRLLQRPAPARPGRDARLGQLRSQCDRLRQLGRLLPRWQRAGRRAGSVLQRARELHTKPRRERDLPRDRARGGHTHFPNTCLLRSVPARAGRRCEETPLCSSFYIIEKRDNLTKTDSGQT